MDKYFFKYLYIIEKYFNNDSSDILYQKWTEPHRFWHNINHIGFILKRLEYYKDKLGKKKYEILIISAYFHDIIYYPDRLDNEKKSIEIFKQSIKNLPQDYYIYIIAIISYTKNNKPPSDKLAELFWLIDNDILINGTFIDMINYEKQIFREYQFINYKKYKTERIKFLENRLIESHNSKIKFLIDYIKNYKPKIGIYAGSFNPLHIGHMNILQKSEKLFDKVIIAYGNNPDKPNRKIKIPKGLRFREVDTYNGLITDYLDNVEQQEVDVTLIRGLRNGYDLNYESTQSQFINDIRPNTNIVYLSCDKKYEHISSSAIRNLMKFDKDKAKKYIVL